MIDNLCPASVSLPLSIPVSFILSLPFLLFALFSVNVVSEWLRVLIRIRDVPGSKLGQEAGYLRQTFFLIFPGSFKQILGYCPKIGHDRFYVLSISSRIISLDAT